MKKYIALILLVVSSIAYGQNLTEKEIVGTWKVEKVSGSLPNIPDEQKKTMGALKDAFLKASFEFKEDKTFNFNIEFMKELDEMMKKVHWKLNASKTDFIIQEWKDKDTDRYQLMGIRAFKRGDKIYFMMTESPFLLEVKKE